MNNAILTILLVAAGIAGTPAMAKEADDARYESSLSRLYDLTYGKELSSVSVDEAVDKFRESARGKAEFKDCPEVQKTMDGFADKEFRQTMVDYMNSPSLRKEILDSMRKHYTQADLDAILAFADTSAGATFLEHNRLADNEVKRALDARVGDLEKSPEMKKMITDMVTKLVPVVMACQSK